MSESADLIDLKSHFAFGKNWESYAKLVTDFQVEQATASMRRLLGGDLKGKRFVDVGCGSGLHSLAALRLGAEEVVALDLDPACVATTRHLLERHAAGACWSTQQTSVFDLGPDSTARYDVVYSWGVLHHTGDLHRALRAAAALVAPGGQFVFALYYRTRLCWFWKLEKRWYSAASPVAQARARSIYVGLFRMLYPLKYSGSFSDFLANYGQRRGMDYYHDVHDWLGGWPYESISALETDRLMQRLGMRKIRAFGRDRKTVGLFGSGCNEYVYGRE
jgi:2-polyprenyl-6-hydroxyphenyl methylase/3-demethylubiquinone-9 3-methyltransferase